ncbi:hypothetical protein HELRODRAFT_64912 [Helobdella robusta]|uniref:Transcription initiation factor IIA subunit 2 n=1 Tax=Helobdella robusta TaxID=6412 RepID=T1FY11_HELRO|nr:hypothetical protein HELRODRAFT_64912 [Helobdella robusta]ESO06569.1 hypothetical protein HELRODRAFT_64912 [Helobdella robusta]
MDYQHYRCTTLGQTFQDTLDELVQAEKITPEMASKALLRFDKTINEMLATKFDRKITFKADLTTYRYVDDVWTMVLENAVFEDRNDTFKVDIAKLVACEAPTLKKKKK